MSENNSEHTPRGTFKFPSSRQALIENESPDTNSFQFPLLYFSADPTAKFPTEDNGLTAYKTIDDNKRGTLKTSQKELRDDSDEENMDSDRSQEDDYEIKKLAFKKSLTMIKFKEQDSDDDKIPGQLAYTPFLRRANRGKTIVPSQRESETFLNKMAYKRVKSVSDVKERFQQRQSVYLTPVNEKKEQLSQLYLNFLRDRVTGKSLVPSKTVVVKEPKLRALLQKQVARSPSQDIDIHSLIAKLKQPVKYQKFIGKITLAFSNLYYRMEYYFYLFFTAIEPMSLGKVIWDICLMFFIIYSLIFDPIQIAFEFVSEGKMRVFEMVQTGFFYADIILTFHTGYYREGLLVKNHKDIAKNYICGWLLLDVVSSFPIGFLQGNDLTDDGSKLIRVLTVFRIARLFRLLKIYRFQRKLAEIKEVYMDNSLFQGIYRFIGLLFGVAFLAHIVACTWYFVSITSQKNGQPSWLDNYHLGEDEIARRYLLSIYWTITTMMTVGYGDLTPQNDGERVMAICVMLIGCGVFGYSINQVASIIEDINNKMSKYSRNIRIINSYMKKNHIDPKMQREIRDYLKFVLECEREMRDDEGEVLQGLSENLRQNLIKSVNGKIIKQCNLFVRNFGSNFLSNLCLRLQEEIYAPNEFVLKEGEADNGILYFLRKGEAEMILRRCNLMVGNVETDQCFGEFSFFTQQIRTFSIRTKTFCSLITLKFEDFMAVCEKYPTEKETYYMIKDKLCIYHDYSILRTTCLLCKQDDHTVFFCPELFHTLIKEQIIDKYLDENFKFAQDFIRNPKRTSNAKYYLRPLRDAASRLQSDYNLIAEGVTIPSLTEGRMNERYEHGSIEITDNSFIDNLSINTETHNADPKNREIYQFQMKSLEKEKDIMPSIQDVINLTHEAIYKPEAPKRIETNMNSQIEFDQIKNYEIYFPQNNLSNMLKYLNKETIHKPRVLDVDHKEDEEIFKLKIRRLLSKRSTTRIGTTIGSKKTFSLDDLKTH